MRNVSRGLYKAIIIIEVITIKMFMSREGPASNPLMLIMK